MSVCYVWAWIAGQTTDGEPIMERVLAAGPNDARPSDVPEAAWLAEQDAEAWWDDILASGRGKRYLPDLAVIIGDGRIGVWRVSARSLRLALRQCGLREAVEAAVAADDTLADWWEYSVDYDRYHPLVISMLITLGVSADQADQVWAVSENL
ncbi:hypothetical protein [Methylomonas sp. HYX-M1]|uniref:hypothetical protein n=1 Tax=Methylomonas sp. HYX-M1 TaxID=3139307 RepID=UPI00345B4F0C